MENTVTQGLLDTLWILVAAGLVFLMQAGFMALEAGLTQRKNNINVAAKNLVDISISIILFWMFGFGLMFGLSAGDRGLFGLSNFSPNLLEDTLQAGATAEGISLAAFFLFQAMFCGTAVTIISGATAERMRFESYLIITAIVSGLIYPIFGHWAWGGHSIGESYGWLASRGFVDFAGGSVVHSIGGWAALAMLLILKPRTGRFAPDGTPRQLARANLPLATLGVFILWFGWFGFNGGSTFALNHHVGVIITNTIIAASAGILAIIPARLSTSRIIEIDYLINGALAGLVSITASAHAVNPREAFIIGMIGAWVMILLDRLLLRLRIDDAVSAVPVHLGGGIWGTLAVALFGDPALLGTGLGFLPQLLMQVVGIFSAGFWAFLTTLVLLNTINTFFPLRVTVEEEAIGLNITEQGAIPDYSDLPEIEALLNRHRQSNGSTHTREAS